MSIGNQFTEPGVYSQFQPTTILPAGVGGARVCALIGDGRPTNLVKGESVTRGSTPSGFDALAHVAVSIDSNIVDQNFISYTQVKYDPMSGNPILGTGDFALGQSGNVGKVSWATGLAATIQGSIAGPFSLVNKTLILSVNGAANQTVTFISGDFSVPSAGTATEVCTAINARATGVTATVDGITGAVDIATTALINTSLLIATGTANVLLGIADGSFQATPRQPLAGIVYHVDYSFAKVAADYVPTFFFDMSDVIAAYGPVSSAINPATGTIQNSISLAAQILFSQGITVMAACQIDPEDGATITQYRNALTKLLPVDGINIVVPLNSDPLLYSDVKAHVDQASSLYERKERIAVIGLKGAPALTTITSYAQGLADKRVVLVYPPSAQLTVGTDATATTLDGHFLAAAIAGIRTSAEFDVADPLTRKEVAGFDSIPDTLLRSQKNLLASAGVTLVVNEGGIPRVYWGLTTDPSTVANREVSTVEIIDYVAVSMRKLLDAIFIGQKILADTPSQVRSTVTAILSDLVQRQVIVAFTNVTATVDNADATQIDVSFSIAPVDPLNFILITYSLSN